MGFRWKDAVKGGINGFRAGSRFGPYGMAAGAAAGAVGGGYGKDIDKKVTGNSQSGMTSGLIETAGNLGSTGGGGRAAGFGGNLFGRFSGGDEEEGYEDNPAVLARKNGEGSGGSISMGGGIMDGIGFGGSGNQGVMNLFNRYTDQSETSEGGGVDIAALLNLLKMSRGM